MKTLKTVLVAAAITVASGLAAQPAQAFCCGFFGFGGGFHVGSGWGWAGPWDYYPGWGWGGPWGYYPAWGGPYYGYPLAGYPVYPLVITAPELVAKK
jgi:hypothetical protein